MNTVEPENIECLCNFIITQQKYIENFNKSLVEEKENNNNDNNIIKNKFKNLCDIVNIEYETIQITNIIKNNIIYENGKKYIISDNLDKFGWLVVAHNSYVINNYLEQSAEWCLIYNNVVNLAKKYSNIYFNILVNGLSHNMTLAIYYGVITTLDLKILCNDELFSFIRKIVSLFNEDQKKIAIKEISNIIKLFGKQF
jgi:hypothetical protein